MRLQSAYQRISPLVAASLYYSGLVPLARAWSGRPGRRLTILNYHRADGNLRYHLLYLRRHYRILPLEAALEELYAPAMAGRPRTDRRPSLAITFDDGYHDNYTIAGALARELRVPISIFLPPGYIDSGARFHWLEGEYLARHAQAPKVTINRRVYQLDDEQEREALAQALDAVTRNLRSVHEREAFLATARSKLAIATVMSPADRAALPMTWDEAHEMEAGGWVTYGAHTMHHPILSRLRDPAETRSEIGGSREELEGRLGHPVRVLAYPYGRTGDIGERAINATQQAGFRWAVTTIPGVNTPRTNPYLLRRMPTDTSESWLLLAAQASGLWWGALEPLMRLLGAPTDTGALPHAPLFARGPWAKVKANLKVLTTRHTAARGGGSASAMRGSA